MKIMILEDNMTSAELFENICLEVYPDATVQRFLDPDIFMMAIHGFEPDVVLLDNDLSHHEKTGLDVAKAIKDIGKFVRVVSVSGDIHHSYYVPKYYHAYAGKRLEVLEDVLKKYKKQGVK